MKNISYLIVVLCIFMIASCSSELDFDQANDIVLTPEIEADLIFFNLGTDNFLDTTTQDTTFVVRDTTRLEFLDDSFIRESVKEIEFRFQVDNSFL